MHKPFSQVQQSVKLRRLIARWFDYRAHELSAFGVVLEIDLVRVESDVKLIGEEAAKFLDFLPALVEGTN